MSNIIWLDTDNFDFPDVNFALTEPDGLLAAGGDLSINRLINAYRSGIFPWYEEEQPILWWSPNPRCVLYPQCMHVSKSLKKTLRKELFTITFDQAFEQVIANCAGLRRDSEGTWITSAMSQAYIRLHQLGLAHSAEVWQQGKLVGGLYGLAMGGVFFGESMFSYKSDASKVALYHLAEKLTELGFRLIDCQVYNPHLESLGATEISREAFLEQLKVYIDNATTSLWRP